MCVCVVQGGGGQPRRQAPQVRGGRGGRGDVCVDGGEVRDGRTADTRRALNE